MVVTFWEIASQLKLPVEHLMAATVKSGELVVEEDVTVAVEIVVDVTTVDVMVVVVEAETDLFGWTNMDLQPARISVLSWKTFQAA